MDTRINLSAETEVKMLEKIIFLFITFIVCFGTGIIPGFYLGKGKEELKSLKYNISLLNTFSCSVGLSIALFMVMPRANEFVHSFFEVSEEGDYGKVVKGLGWAFVAAFFSYSFSLVLQKVLFASSEGGHHHHHHHGEEEAAREQDENEEAFKTVLGSKGKFATFLAIQNIRKSLAGDGEDIAVKTKGSILRASMVLAKSKNNKDDMIKALRENDDMDLMVNPNNVVLESKSEKLKKDKKTLEVKEAKNEVNDQKIQEKKKEKHNHDHDHGHDHHKHDHDDEDSNDKSILMAYLLLGAISFHGVFLGFSLGVLEKSLEIIAIGTWILIYKALESFSMGLVLRQAGLSRISILRMTFLSTCFVPLGIIIGSLAKFNLLTRGILMGISVGTMAYQTCSETVIEEFTFTKNRFTKFFIFVSGAILVGVTSVLIEIE